MEDKLNDAQKKLDDSEKIIEDKSNKHWYQFVEIRLATGDGHVMAKATISIADMMKMENLHGESKEGVIALLFNALELDTERKLREDVTKKSKE